MHVPLPHRRCPTFARTHRNNPNECFYNNTCTKVKYFWYGCISCKEQKKVCIHVTTYVKKLAVKLNIAKYPFLSHLLAFIRRTLVASISVCATQLFPWFFLSSCNSNILRKSKCSLNHCAYIDNYKNNQTSKVIMAIIIF